MNKEPFDSRNSSVNRLFEKAITYRDKGRVREAVVLLRVLLNKLKIPSKLATVHVVLGGILFDLAEYNEALFHSKEAIRLKPDSELASLEAYLCYVELEDYESAIDEIERFLDKHPAKLYLTTLKELLKDIKKGYAVSFKERIFILARRNNVLDKSVGN